MNLERNLLLYLNHNIRVVFDCGGKVEKQTTPGKGLKTKSIKELPFSMIFRKFQSRKRYIRDYILLMITVVAHSPIHSFGAFEKVESGAASIAMGNALVALKQFPFALYYNPAALPSSGDIQIVFTYHNLYGFSDLNQVNVLSNFQIGRYPFAMAIDRLGNRYYQEIQFTAGSKYNITSDCAIGVSAQLYILTIRNYGQKITGGINFSIFFNVLPEFSVGAMVTNVNQPKISQVQEKLPQTMNLGFCYYPFDALTVTAELFRDIRFEPEYRAGILYKITGSLDFRAGIEDKLDIYSFGLGIQATWIGFDYALRLHQILGNSHLISIMMTL
jgi:hypothetical protein